MALQTQAMYVFLAALMLAEISNRASATSSDMWYVRQGPCAIDSEGCVMSPGYPDLYPTSQTCVIQVYPGNERAIRVEHFATEASYDVLSIDGQAYSGDFGPDGVVPTGAIRWFSDYSIASTGWKLCPAGVQVICLETLTGKGEDYRGCQTESRNGFVCLDWADGLTTPQRKYNPKAFPDADLSSNYCRNPGGDRETIWCYTAGTDIEWDYCNPNQVFFEVNSGDCQVNGNCLSSPNYPKQYDNNENCNIDVGRASEGGVLSATSFSTETGYDWLNVGNNGYTGTGGPENIKVTSGLTLRWTSDYSTVKSGWEICVTFPTTITTTLRKSTTSTVVTTTATTTWSSTGTVSTSTTSTSSKSSTSGSLTSTTTSLTTSISMSSTTTKVSSTTRTTTSISSFTITTTLSTTITSLTSTISTSTTATSSSVSSTITITSTPTTTTSTVSTVTSTTSDVIYALEGVLVLDVQVDADVAVQQLEGTDGLQALKEGIAASFSNLEPERVIITAVWVYDASRVSSRRLATGKIGVEYEIRSDIESPVFQADMEAAAASGGFKSNLDQAFIDRSISVPVDLIVNVKKSTTTHTVTSLTTTSFTTSKSTTTSLSTTSKTMSLTSSTTASKSSSTATTTTLVSVRVRFAGDYASVVGNKKQMFLQECSEKLSPVLCIDVEPGSLILVLAASTDLVVQSAASSVEITGLSLPSFAPLQVITTTTTTRTVTTSTSTSGTSTSSTITMTTTSFTTTTSLTATLSTTTSTTISTTTSSVTSSTVSTTTTPPPVDCEFSEWSDWGKCDKPCNGGIHRRDRNEKVKAKYNGQPCVGNFSETGLCNTETCPGCAPGFYLTIVSATETECHACTAGRFNPDEGATSEAACQACMPGTESFGAASNCTDCKIGFAAERRLMLAAPTNIAAVSGLFVAGEDDISLPSQACTSNCDGAIEFSAFCKNPVEVYFTAEVLTMADPFSSFFLQVGSSFDVVWELGIGSGWRISSDSVRRSLPSGQFTVSLKVREHGISIRSLTMHYVDPNDFGCGFYKSFDEWTCGLCRPGSSAPRTGMIECEPCAAGTFSGQKGTTSCEECQAGTYSITQGSTSDADCESCPMGRFNGVSGASDISMCLDCEPGRYNPSEGASSCEACPAGTFGIERGQLTQSDACESCLPGTYSEIPGLTSCNLCIAGTFLNFSGSNASDDCRPCPLGMKSTMASASCEECDAGSFAPLTGSSTCTACDPGRFSNAAADSCTACSLGRFALSFSSTSCDLCEAGRYSITLASQTKENCLECPAGKFNDSEGASDQDHCKNCPAGSSSGAAATGCEFCGAGRFSDTDGSPICKECLLGRFADDSGSLLCEECSPGKHADPSDRTRCIDCARGRFNELSASEGDDSCIPCSSGRASNILGSGSSGSCMVCPAGKFAQSGSTECSACPPGMFSNQEAASCSVCPLGRFSKKSGTSECSLCESGTYNDDSSSAVTTCKLCPPGTIGDFEGATSVGNCTECPKGTVSPGHGLTVCELCPLGSVSRSAGQSLCEECSSGSATPLGALGCCPANDPDAWTISPAGSLITPPGKSKSRIHHLVDATSCEDIGNGKYTNIPAEGRNMTNGQIHLVTLNKERIQSCVQLGCDEVDREHCDLEIVTQGLENFGVGDGFEVQARIDVFGGEKTTCGGGVASVLFEGFGCAPRTLEYFLLALSGVVSATVMLGLMIEMIAHSRLQVLIECSFTVKLPTKKKSYVTSPTAASSKALRSVASASTAAEATDVSVDAKGDDADPTMVELRVAAADTPVSKPAGDSLPLDSMGSVASGEAAPETLEVLEGERRSSESSERAEAPGMLWPSEDTLKKAVIDNVGLEPSRMAKFSVWLIEKKDEAPALQVEFAIQAPRGEHMNLRRRMASAQWRMASTLPAPWSKATVEQQPVAIIKARGQAPGMDFLDMLERCSAAMLGEVGDEDSDSHQLHLRVARSILDRLTSRTARFLLGLQYLSNLLAAGLLPWAGYELMTSCDQGFPAMIHGAWLGYMCLTTLLSMLVLFSLGGDDIKPFCKRFGLSLLFRAASSFVLLTDTYQDATFPVIANKCNFELWFVSAWLVTLGVGVMQVFTQLITMTTAFVRYSMARTPEERDHILVQGAFMALRGSDNLVLVYAVRPAVEERLGGSSSWGMKMAEARIAFLRFIFEDVEQSALQAVFLIFYEDAALVDKVWVSASIATSLLLSFTMVVQCIPEVRDWLWHRIFANIPFCRTFPLLRVPALVVSLLLYRSISTYPWISACSPRGDPCPGNRQWWEFWWGCDSSDRVTLFGLEARTQVVEEVLDTSLIGVVIIMAALFLAASAWWLRHWLQSRKKYRSLGQVDTYSFSRRFGTSEGSGSSSDVRDLLRPRNSDDEDLWLKYSRSLYEEMDRRESFPTATDQEKATAHKVKSLLTSIDKSSYALNRGHLQGSTFNIPGSQWLLQRRLAQNLDALAKATEPLDRAMKETTEYLDRAIKHTEKVANVRAHVKRLLLSQSFVKAGVEQKAWRIIEGKGVPPLKLIHWERIKALGYLPKYSRSSANGATHVDEILEEVATRLSCDRAKAERRLVVFMLSHRWLRTSGKTDHHPDTEDNIKAKKLVAFAQWFKQQAERKRMQVEVAFWIDYCCTEQDDPLGIDLAIAALPLFVACCTKVLAWRTADFDRRCWTMLERLLSYSFCRGGLTPYVIDETFEGIEEKEEVVGVAEERLPVWQVKLDGDVWVDFDAPAQAILRAARESDLPRTQLESGGRRYQIDLKHMKQRNTITGGVRHIREKVPEEAPTDIPVASETDVKRLAKRRGTQVDINLPDIVVGDEARNEIVRTVKKLPDPLDPECCLISRDTYRRHIASLVSMALSVPAFEVFADRQQVEWGLTEVIELSLTSRSRLQRRRTSKREESTDEASMGWVELHDGGMGTKGFSIPRWRLTVLDPKRQYQKRLAAAWDDLDAHIWIDLGVDLHAYPTSPTEIDRLFDQVDLAMDRGTGEDQELALRELVLSLKADLKAAHATGDDKAMEEAVIRSREVELPVKQDVIERLVSRKLQAALESGSELEMRNALRFARSKGTEHTEAYKRVDAEQKRLYEEQLVARLVTAAADRDIATLAAVHSTAQSKGCPDVAQQVTEAAKQEVIKAAKLPGDQGVTTIAEMQSAARDSGWAAIEEFAKLTLLRLTMERALVRAQAASPPDLATLRAVEQRARREKSVADIAERASKLVNEAAKKVSHDMGLPAGWDVVEMMAGIESARLLKKDEETETALLNRIQQLVDITFTGWGGYGARTRTRDRGKEPVAKRLEVMSVVYVQNAESYVNYIGRRQQIADSFKPDTPHGDVWDIKTTRMKLEGVGRHKENPVDSKINEHYLWHGCTPIAAQGITDSNFDLKRAGSAFGSLFGPGIYMAESCMKADEYTKPDDRGYFPMLLCRATLGNIKYCDHPSPVTISAELVAACKPDGGHHSVLGDREKVVKTFREFIVFDNHQVYPEYIIWYRRVY